MRRPTPGFRAGPYRIRPIGLEESALPTRAQGRLDQPAPSRRIARDAQGPGGESQDADPAPDPHADRGATRREDRESEEKGASQSGGFDRLPGKTRGLRSGSERSASGDELGGAPFRQAVVRRLPSSGRRGNNSPRSTAHSATPRLAPATSESAAFVADFCRRHVVNH